MKPILGVVTEIIKNEIVDTRIGDDSHKRMITYKYICNSHVYQTVSFFDLDEDWKEQLFVGKIIEC